MSSCLYPQFKYMIFHIFTCIFKTVAQYEVFVHLFLERLEGSLLITYDQLELSDSIFDALIRLTHILHTMSFFISLHCCLLQEVFVSSVYPCQVFSWTVDAPGSIGISKTGVRFVIVSQIRFVFIDVHHQAKNRIASFWVPTNSKNMWVVSGYDYQCVFCSLLERRTILKSTITIRCISFQVN